MAPLLLALAVAALVLLGSGWDPFEADEAEVPAIRLERPATTEPSADATTSTATPPPEPEPEVPVPPRRTAPSVVPPATFVPGDDADDDLHDLDSPDDDLDSPDEPDEPDHDDD